MVIGGTARRFIAHLGAFPAVVSGGSSAPTHELARSWYSSLPQVAGFLAPSARSPSVSNLVLFHDRMPSGAITVTGRAGFVL